MDKIYLIVAYCFKDEAKKFGARWDDSRSLWYTTKKNPFNGELFAKFVKYDDAMAVKNNPLCDRCGNLYSIKCIIGCQD